MKTVKHIRRFLKELVKMVFKSDLAMGTIFLIGTQLIGYRVLLHAANGSIMDEPFIVRGIAQQIFGIATTGVIFASIAAIWGVFVLVGKAWQASVNLWHETK